MHWLIRSLRDPLNRSLRMYRSCCLSWEERELTKPLPMSVRLTCLEQKLNNQYPMGQLKTSCWTHPVQFNSKIKIEELLGLYARVRNSQVPISNHSRLDTSWPMTSTGQLLKQDTWPRSSEPIQPKLNLMLETLLAFSWEPNTKGRLQEVAAKGWMILVETWTLTLWLELGSDQLWKKCRPTENRIRQS